jgi:putative membrane protein
MWNYGHPGYMAYDGGWFWGMGLHGLVWLVFLAVVIAAGVALVRYLWRSSSGPASSRDSALDILKTRYARGEINHEEFQAKKKDLSE